MGGDIRRQEDRYPPHFLAPGILLALTEPSFFPTGSVGISAHAASALGDVVFVELPEKGLELEEGDTMGAVESVKSASDLYAPVGGKVVEVNGALEEKASIINKSPEQDGWITRIELKEGEADRVKEKLMQAEDYKKFTE